MTFTAVLTLPDGRRHVASLPDSGGWAVLANPDLASETSLGWHLYALHDGSHVHRFSNGVVPDFCGAIYFVDLAVTHDALSVLPMRPDLEHAGKWLAIVASLPHGSTHLWRPRQQRRVRCALHDGTPAGLLHAVDVLRYRTAAIADPVRDYGATRSRLPRVNRAQLAAERQQVARYVQAALSRRGPCGTQDGIFAARSIGPWWCNGSDSGAEYGGRMINPTLDASDAQCADGLFLRSLAHELQMDRAFEAMHNRTTGQPVSIYEAKATQSLLTDAGAPERWRVELDPFLTGPYDARRYQRFNSAAPGACPYELDWWAVEKVDPAHGCRALECGVALAEIAGDESAKDDIWMLAESWRQVGWSDRADELVASAQPPGAWIPPSLTAKLDALHVGGPHRGSPYVNREFAWVAQAGCLAAKYGRGAWVQWLRRMSDLAEDALDPLGLCGRDYDPAGMPAGVRGVMSFHEALCVAARCALGRSATWPNLLWQTSVRSTALALTAPSVRKEYSNDDGKGDGTFGPAHWLWSEARGVTLPKLDARHSSGPGDPAHELAACALAYRATGDRTLLDRALTMWVPHASLKDRLAWLRAQYPMKGWGAELESVLEDLEAKGEL